MLPIKEYQLVNSPVYLLHVGGAVGSKATMLGIIMITHYIDIHIHRYHTD